MLDEAGVEKLLGILNLVLYSPVRSLDVVVITSNYQLENLIREMNINKGSTSLKFRKSLSQDAFNETAYYDSNISKYFNRINDNKFPKKITINPVTIVNCGTVSFL